MMPLNEPYYPLYLNRKIMTNRLSSFLLRMNAAISMDKYISDWINVVNRKIDHFKGTRKDICAYRAESNSLDIIQ